MLLFYIKEQLHKKRKQYGGEKGKISKYQMNFMRENNLQYFFCTS